LKAESLTPQDLDSVAQDYASLLLNPECKIYHVLKTIYKKGQDLSEEKKIFSTITSGLLHTIPINAKRVASRPNAIIKNGEIWVRQGEYLDLSSEIKASYQEYLSFENLTPEGIDKSIIHYYTFDKQGNLKFDSEVKQSVGKISSKPNKMVSSRTQSYWTLPTYVDAVYIDLTDAAQKWQGDQDPQNYIEPEDTLLLLRIEKLMELARKELNL
jgi:hypothetical protein